MPFSLTTKHPAGKWAQGEFSLHSLQHPNGETSQVFLDERGPRLSNGLWVRELRELDKSGHQTAILSTDYKSALEVAASAMFARWNQENSFKYMRGNYGLEKLVEYGIRPLPENTRLVNPAWRELDSKVRRVSGLLNRQRAQFWEHTLGALESEPELVAQHEAKKGKVLGALQARESELSELKAKGKNHPNTWKSKICLKNSVWRNCAAVGSALSIRSNLWSIERRRHWCK